MSEMREVWHVYFLNGSAWSLSNTGLSVEGDDYCFRGGDDFLAIVPREAVLILLTGRDEPAPE